MNFRGKLSRNSGEVWPTMRNLQEEDNIRANLNANILGIKKQVTPALLSPQPFVPL